MLSPETTFKNCSRQSALVLLGLVVISIALLVAVSFGTHPPAGAADAQSGDLALYQRIVDRLRHGEAYYPAAHAELLAGDYPTLSVFNWRTPLLLSLVALAPSDGVAQAFFAAVAAAAGALVVLLFKRQGNALLIAAVLVALCVSLATVATPQTVLFGEVVAGVLILGSLTLYGLERPSTGMLLALAALFCRELAAPYVLLCLALAIGHRRWAELALGLAGVLGFAAYFWLHAQAVWAQLGPADINDAGGWLTIGGLWFALTTAAFNGFFMIGPLWVSALVLPLGLLGLFAFPAGVRMGLVAAGYVLLFDFIGKPFNDYWGAMYTPLLALGLAWAPFALRDLVQAVRVPRATPVLASDAPHRL